jgi:hypothetical protein
MADCRVRSTSLPCRKLQGDVRLEAGNAALRQDPLDSRK